MNHHPLIEGKDFYYDEHGYVVFTEAYHIAKGYCCGHGCRHCPFEYESVPEPRKSELVEQKKHSAVSKA
ncbi:DUF5522 domain-containing protein [Sediminibacterium goheungense]|uniref:Uncharacterized protein n=1 Tax=Sediminibacterium goheungense TaxID=1086393 RepID=A0A4R6IV84_9BACT|nr:hypothetical protein BC659_1860 [Sediminibacterium goheungense]